MRVPMHILNATEVTNSKNGVDTANANSSQILKMNPLFFITQNCLNQRKTLLYLRSCSATIFIQYDKSPGKYTSKSCLVETKPVCKS